MKTTKTPPSQGYSDKITFKSTFGRSHYMEILVDDVGSFPLPITIKQEEFNQAYRLAREAYANGKDPRQDTFTQKNFCQPTIDSFKIKLNTGLDITNYPQQYDGIRQVSDILHQAMEKGTFTVEENQAFLPEVRLITEEAKNLSQEIGNKIRLRVSLFGPIEQYLKEIGTTYYPDVLENLTETIRRFAKNSIIDEKYIKTDVISIDEPSLGYIDINTEKDKLVQHLEKAFDFQNVTKQIHLHSATRLPDLLTIKNLNVVSFEYAASPKNIEGISRAMLERANKQIRVGITRTDIDSILSEIYDAGITNPTIEQLVDTEDEIARRYVAGKQKFGERMTFTGPDCGLGSWPTQEAAEALLKKTVRAVKMINLEK
jgi:5-methyltetrahydropteroyltriglutamate--homocysteine methyltransferase